MKFKYTKVNGDVSDRHLVVIRKPSDLYFGIDVTSIDDKGKIEDLTQFISGQNTELSEVIKELGLSDRYRSFIKDGVSFYE